MSDLCPKCGETAAPAWLCMTPDCKQPPWRMEPAPLTPEERAFFEAARMFAENLDRFKMWASLPNYYATDSNISKHLEETYRALARPKAAQGEGAGS